MHGIHAGGLLKKSNKRFNSEIAYVIRTSLTQENTQATIADSNEN